MNRHLRALLIVLGIGILATVATIVILKSRTGSDEADVGQGHPVAINSTLSDFQAKTLDGKTISLAEFSGKLVVVNFWASWCGACIEEMPSLINLLKQFPGKLELIAISGDSNREDIESFLKSFPELKTLPNIYLVWDENKELSQKFQIFRLPESMLVDGKRKVIKKIAGSIDWSSSDAIQYITQLSAENGAEDSPDSSH